MHIVACKAITECNLFESTSPTLMPIAIVNLQSSVRHDPQK